MFVLSLSSRPCDRRGQNKRRSRHAPGNAPRAHTSPPAGAQCTASNGVADPALATEHGAATTPFADRIGRLAPGKLADMVLLDWSDITWPYQDPDMPLVDVLVRRAKSGAVQTVLIGGQVVYNEGCFTRIDKKSILEDIARTLDRPYTAAEAAQRRLASDLMGPVREFYEDWL